MNVKAVVLAAGEGKRMHPLTYTRPKVMVPVAGKPMLAWNLLHAKQAGISDFLFVVSYKSEMVRDYFKDGSDYNVSIEYVNQGKPKGTGHAVGMVEPFIDNDFLVLSGDTVFGVDDILTMIKQNQTAIGVYQVNNPAEYGVVETTDQRVVHIHEKMKKPLSDIINTGLYHFTPSVFDIISTLKLSVRGEYELTDAINITAKKQHVSAVPISFFRDVGYPWDMLQANEELMDFHSFHHEGTIENNVSINGDVSIGKGTIIKNGSYIEGPVIIGNDCRIGPNCYIRPTTSIGNQCHIGAASEVKNSIILDESNIPHHNYVGDSVIGAGCNLGSGTKVANLRLDKKTITVIHENGRINTKRRKLGVIMGDNVQTGINSMLNVGSIIGNNVFIGPGAVVSGEIQPETQLY